MAAAENAGARVLLGFSHSRSRYKRVPQDAALAAPLPARVPALPGPLPVHQELPHLERGEPPRPADVEPPEAAPAATTTSCATTAATCTIVGPSVLDSLDDAGLGQAGRGKAASTASGIWAIHNYIDANRFRTRGTRSLLRATKARIWFTETGGLVRRDNGSRIEFAESPRHAVKATKWVLKLARLSPRVRRVYFYHWTAPAPEATWDSALIDRRGPPAPRLRRRAHVRAPAAGGVAPARRRAPPPVRRRALALALVAAALAQPRLREPRGDPRRRHDGRHDADGLLLAAEPGARQLPRHRRRREARARRGARQGRAS